MSPDRSRLSINRWTCRTTPLPELVDASAAEGITTLGLWRQDVADLGIAPLRRLVDEAGIQVSSLCRGGFLTTADPTARLAALDDNRRAIEEAHALGTDTLVLVVGGLPEGDRDIVAARQRVTEGIAELVPEAEQAGVRLAIEPMNPIFAADRGVASTTAQSLDMAVQADGTHQRAVGVVVDVYHVWWDPEILPAIARAGAEGRLASFQICDWTLPLAAEVLHARGYPGDGFADIPALTAAVTASGYTGPIEVEIFREDIWETPVREVVRTCAERYDELVSPHL